MSNEELKKRVDEIIAMAYDPEAAHSSEDDLYIALLTEYLPVDMLKEVMRLQKADFARWTA